MKCEFSPPRSTRQEFSSSSCNLPIRYAEPYQVRIKTGICHVARPRSCDLRQRACLAPRFRFVPGDNFRDRIPSPDQRGNQRRSQPSWAHNCNVGLLAHRGQDSRVPASSQIPASHRFTQSRILFSCPASRKRARRRCSPRARFIADRCFGLRPIKCSNHGHSGSPRHCAPQRVGCCPCG